MRSIALLPYPKMCLIHDITVEHVHTRLDEFHIVMGRTRKLWLKADSPESMSASWCVSCDRSVCGSCGGSCDSSCGGISNCVSCDVSCSETAVEKSFVGGDLRCRPCIWFTCPWHVCGTRWWSHRGASIYNTSSPSTRINLSTFISLAAVGPIISTLCPFNHAGWRAASCWGQGGLLGNYGVRHDGVGGRPWCCRFRCWPGSGHRGINLTIDRPI